MASTRRAVTLIAFALLCGSVALWASSYRVYWGGDETVCLTPTATDSITSWSVTGEASAHLTVDDITTAPCCNIDADDMDATYIACAAAATDCEVTFTLSDMPAGDGEIASVSPWMILRGESASLVNVQLDYVINSTRYTGCTVNNVNASYNDRPVCGSTIVNPATLLPWTFSDLNGLKLLIDDVGSSSTITRVTAAGVGVGLFRRKLVEPADSDRKKIP